MGLTETDYLLRAIQRLAQAIAAVIRKKQEGEPGEARRMLDDLRVELFRGMGAALDAVDPASVVSLAGGMDKARAYAMLLAAEADLRAEDEPRWAARARRRALEVHLEAAARHPAEVQAEDRDAVARLADLVDTAKLPARLAAVLEKVRAAR